MTSSGAQFVSTSFLSFSLPFPQSFLLNFPLQSLLPSGGKNNEQQGSHSPPIVLQIYYSLPQISPPHKHIYQYFPLPFINVPSNYSSLFFQCLFKIDTHSFISTGVAFFHRTLKGIWQHLFQLTTFIKRPVFIDTLYTSDEVKFSISSEVLGSDRRSRLAMQMLQVIGHISYM